MTDSLGDRIRSEAAIASRHGQYDRLMRIAEEVDDALMALVRVNQRLTGGEATRAVDPPPHREGRHCHCGPIPLMGPQR